MLKNICKSIAIGLLAVNLANASIVGVATVKAPQPTVIANQIAFAQLIKAIKQGDIPGVQKAIQSGAAVNGRSQVGQTPLILAINAKNADAVRLLLSLNANPNIPSIDGQFQMTPICLASLTGQREIVDLLLSTETDLGLHSIQSDDKGQMIALSPVACAASVGHSDVLAKLLQSKASPNFEKSVEYSKSPLFIAVSRGKPDIIPLLCGSKANVDEVLQGISLLRFAFSVNDSQAASNLLQCKANPSWRDSSGVSELRYLVRSNNLDGIRMIGKFKPNLKDQLDGVSIFQETVAGDLKIKILRALISSGASPKGEKLLGKLMVPVLSGWVDQSSPEDNINFMMELIRKGVSTDEIINSEGLASYMMSSRVDFYAQNGVFELFEELVKRDLRLSEPDAKGDLFLVKSYLALRNNPEKFTRILDLFLSKGIDINAPQPSDGRNLLDVVARSNESVLKKVLMDRGACRMGRSTNSMWKYCG